MSKNINTFAAGLLALTSIAAASVGCQPQASEQTAANPTEFVEQTETVETEAASTFELTEEPTEEPTAEPVEPTAESTAESTEEPAFEVQGYKVFATKTGYSILVQGEMYPLGEINPEDIRLEKGVAISVVQGEKITSVIIPQKKMQINCIDVVSFRNIILIQEEENIMWMYDGKTLFRYKGKKIKLIDVYGCYLNGEEVRITDIPWEPGV